MINKKDYKVIGPFKGWVLQNFPFIEADFDAITSYQLWCKVVEYLNKVIYNEALLEEQSDELVDAFNELKTYVDNLDLQEEVNNKLDEMAEDGTLENIVKDYLNTKCEFIFPGRWGYNLSGNSNIVRFRDKVILFDTNHSGVYSYLKLMLLDYNINHIDYVIVSHFDSDHVGNLESLITDGFIDENSVYYHPACPSEIYSQTIIDLYNNIESICSARNITSIIPTEKQVVNIFDDFSLKFGNCDTAYTRANYNNPNEASMIVEINHNGYKSLMMADSQVTTLQRLYETNFITSEIGLYTIPHHAINSATYFPFYDIINPKVAVSQTQMRDFNENKLVLNSDSSILNDKGCTNYYSCLNEENIYFTEQMGNLICINGLPHATMGKYATPINIYVNSSVLDNAIQDGTEEHPYRDLSQAVGCIADYPSRHINIILAPGTYGTRNPRGSAAYKNRINLFNWKNIITITTSGDNTDTFIADGISISNCFKVKISNVTIYATDTRNYCAYLNNSNVYFENCKFESDTTDKRDYGVFSNEWSNVTLRNCLFNYLENGIDCRGNSEVILINNTFNNLTRIFYTDTSSTIINHSTNNSSTDYTTIDNINNYGSGTYPSVINSQGINLDNSKMTGSINLPFKSNNIYKFIEFDYEMRWNNNQVGRNKYITKLEDLSAFTLSDYNLQSSGSLKIFSCIINISYTNGTLTISRNSAGSLDNGVMEVHSPADADTADYGIKITAIKLF